MPGNERFRVLAVLSLALTLACLGQSAGAQSLEELDRLSQASEKPDSGLALARSQADAGALLEALATLERVLTAKPDAKPVRLLHASLLCRIDDLAGAAVEFGRLKARDFKKAEWAAAQAPCNRAAPAPSGG